jgi:putative tricarboxylic transport membrane protein
MVRGGSRRQDRQLSEERKSSVEDRMKRADVTVALSLIGLAVFILLEAGKLSFGSMRVPQTAFFPVVLATLLLILSLILLVEALRGAPTGRGIDRIEAEGWVRIGATLATLVGFALVLERLGFLLSTFLLMVLLLRAIEPQAWHKVLAVALVTSLVAYVIFGWLLGIPLPAGVLGN